MNILVWLYFRLRPRPGWLPFLLLLSIVGTLIGAVVAARWIPQVGLIGPLAMGGFLLGTVLALRPLKTRWAWLIILAYSLVGTFLIMGQLWPPLATTLDGWPTTADFIRRQMLLVGVRYTTWQAAVAAGNATQETLVFALGLGWLAWLLPAYAAWTTFRQWQPIRGLTPLGIALGVNYYFSDIDLWPVLMFIPLAALLAAAIHYFTLEEAWDRRGIDYSTEIRTELLAAAATIAFVLLVLAWFLPLFRPAAIAEAFRKLTIVQEAEDTVSLALAGVRQPARGNAAEGADPGDGEPATGLPRALLMGNPVELYQTVAMTATVSFSGNLASEELADPNWRGLSYDVYTGRGWTVSQWDDISPLPANTVIYPANSGLVVTQTVHWLLDDRQTRYLFGLPVTLAEPTLITWHGEDDLARIQGEGGDWYQAVSVINQRTPDELRQLDAVLLPAEIVERYTELPNRLPDRVGQLAQEITAFAPTRYDQAVALEQFLRQYPYTLSVTRPQGNGDIVDYFLFDLQKGYCDYYASAMAVMARTLGIPARLVIGYKAVVPDENGVQRLVQANAHSWPELYLPGAGWIAFEPTAAYPTWNQSPIPETADLGSPVASEPVTIPLREPAPTFPWLAVIGLLAVVAAWYGWWRWQSQWLQVDGIHWAYARLQRRAAQLGHPPQASQTPYEFVTAFIHYLGRFPRRQSEELPDSLQQLTDAYVLHQYTASKERDPIVGYVLWQKLSRPLWRLLVWFNWGRRQRGKDGLK